METSTVLKQKANEIIETLGKVFPKSKISEVSIEIGTDSVYAEFGKYTEWEIEFSLEENGFIISQDGPYPVGRGKTCAGAFIAWMDNAMSYLEEEKNKIFVLNTNLLGLGDKK